MFTDKTDFHLRKNVCTPSLINKYLFYMITLTPINKAVVPTFFPSSKQEGYGLANVSPGKQTHRCMKR